MLEESPAGSTGDDELAYTALLYASGELEGDDAVAFEQRLAEDQTARDALCQAVEYTTLASGQTPTAPDPAYRDRVRQRLRHRRRQIQNEARHHSAFGPAVLWIVLGATAAILVMIVLGHMATHPRSNIADDLQPTGTPADAAARVGTNTFALRWG